MRRGRGRQRVQGRQVGMGQLVVVLPLKQVHALVGGHVRSLNGLAVMADYSGRNWLKTAAGKLKFPISPMLFSTLK